MNVHGGTPHPVPLPVERGEGVINVGEVRKPGAEDRTEGEL